MRVSLPLHAPADPSVTGEGAPAVQGAADWTRGVTHRVWPPQRARWSCRPAHQPDGELEPRQTEGARRGGAAQSPRPRRKKGGRRHSAERPLPPHPIPPLQAQPLRAAHSAHHPAWRHHCRLQGSRQETHQHPGEKAELSSSGNHGDFRAFQSRPVTSSRLSAHIRPARGRTSHCPTEGTPGRPGRPCWRPADGQKAGP